MYSGKLAQENFNKARIVLWIYVNDSSVTLDGLQLLFSVLLPNTSFAVIIILYFYQKNMFDICFCAFKHNIVFVFYFWESKKLVNMIK